MSVEKFKAVEDQVEEEVRVEQRPTVGRIVHYQSYGTAGGEYQSVPRAAIITAVAEVGTRVSLAVLNPTGMFFNEHVEYGPDGKAGTWRWPPRV